jgi:hypothetical protein
MVKYNAPVRQEPGQLCDLQESQFIKFLNTPIADHYFARANLVEVMLRVPCPNAAMAAITHRAFSLDILFIVYHHGLPS